MNIEELAFKNYHELKDTQKVDLLLIIEFLQKDRKQWINQYTTAHNDYVNLQQEKTKLKEENERYRKLGFKYLNEQNEKLKHILDELEKYLKKQTIELELIREDISADHYVDRKMFLKEVINKIKELRGRE